MGSAGHPGAHGAGPGKQERTGAQSGVHEVFAQTAIQLLDDDDGERIADYNHPVGNADRAGKRQKHTRNHRGQIADGLGPFHNFTVQPFKEHTRCHRHRSDRQRAEPEKVDRSHQRRDHGDDHVQHDRADILIAANVGRRGCLEVQFRIIHLS